MYRKSDLGLLPAVYTGLVGGVAALLLALVGMVEALSQRFLIAGVVSLGHTLLLVTGVVIGSAAVQRSRRAARRAPVLDGAVAGAVMGAVLALLTIIGRAVSLREVLANASPTLFKLLAFNQNGAGALVLLPVAGAVIAAIGAILAVLPAKVSRPLLIGLTAMLLGGLFQELIAGILQGLHVPAVVGRVLFRGRSLSVNGAVIVFAIGVLSSALWHAGKGPIQSKVAGLPPAERKILRWVTLAAGVLALFWLPQVVGSFLSYVLVMVGLFILMGLGLNLEVGWTGLLDLGFVAFFAIGAYTVGILTSPAVGWFQWSFWAALPVAVVMSLIAGVLLGVPVLGMRGDYIAIATLGFGEIVRLLVASDWLRPFTGGAQGITAIAKPAVGGFEIVGPQRMYYLVAVACLGALLIAGRLRHSRLGRAWMAIREDEDVARAIGIDLMGTKLLAYGLGAGFAGVAGAIFGAMIGSVYPHSFGLIYSINVLSLIIVGGMGSIPGVFVGALILVGLPELLREFAEFRLLIYGALLIAMMLMRPQGFWPEASVHRSLQQTEQPALASETGKAVAPGQAG